MSKREPVGSLWPHNTRSAHDDEKRYAAQAVSNAIKLGLLVQQPCEACGGVDAEAHHEDYSKPLIVRWLCKRDHLARHGRTLKERPYARTRRRALEMGKRDILRLTQQIRDEMDRQRLSQRQLASLAGVTQPMVHRWFASGFKTLGSVFLAARALNLTVDISVSPRESRQKEQSHVRGLSLTVQ